MNAFDLSPLFRTAIGFDRLGRLVDSALSQADAPAYPPYNIEKTGDDTYRLTMAVAGFGPDDIELTVKENTLLVTGRGKDGNGERQYLHRGIAGRAFERRFVLADHLVVEGASLENGMLHVELRRVVPEALKPRRIEIQASAPTPKVIETEVTAQLPKAA